MQKRGACISGPSTSQNIDPCEVVNPSLPMTGHALGSPLILAFYI